MVKLNLLVPKEGNVYQDIIDGKLAISKLSPDASRLSETEKEDLLRKIIVELENGTVPVVLKLVQIVQTITNESKRVSFDDINDDDVQELHRVAAGQSAVFAHNTGKIIFTLDNKAIIPEHLAYNLFMEICVMLMQSGEILNLPEEGRISLSK